MLAKILGSLDIFVGVVFWLYGVLNYSGINLIPVGLISALGIILLIKGLIFVMGLDVMSFLDVASAVIIIAAASFTLPIILVCLVSLFLVQKGFFSLIG